MEITLIYLTRINEGRLHSFEGKNYSKITVVASQAIHTMILPEFFTGDFEKGISIGL